MLIYRSVRKRLSQKSNLWLLKYSENSRMKAFVFIASILTTVTLVYSADFLQLHKFYSTATMCTNKLNLPGDEPNSEIVKCLLNQYHLLDDMGTLKLYEAKQNLNHLISNPSTLAEMQKRLDFCSHYGATGGYPHERIERLSGCLLPIVGFIDKV